MSHNHYSFRKKTPNWPRVFHRPLLAQKVYLVRSREKNDFVTATKLGTTNKFFVAATKTFAAATKRFVDRTKHFVVVTKYFYPYFNKWFCWCNKTFYTVMCDLQPLPDKNQWRKSTGFEISIRESRSVQGEPGRRHVAAPDTMLFFERQLCDAVSDCFEIWAVTQDKNILVRKQRLLWWNRAFSRYRRRWHWQFARGWVVY